jgi:hypothetical protein
MQIPLPRLSRRLVLPLLLAAGFAPGLGWTQPAQPVRVRGTVESVAADLLVVRDRRGERVTVALAPGLTMTEMYPLPRDAVKAGSFVGVGAMPQADGSQKAIAILVFPEAMRGTGEGHRPFDFLPQSTMTNATVIGEAVPSADGQHLQLTYPGGQKAIVVPPEAPIVSLRPATRDLLVPGAGVSVTVQVVGDQPTATRITAGKNGFNPPY